jgi:hypothetical protein
MNRRHRLRLDGIARLFDAGALSADLAVAQRSVTVNRNNHACRATASFGGCS